MRPKDSSFDHRGYIVVVFFSSSTPSSLFETVRKHLGVSHDLHFMRTLSQRHEHIYTYLHALGFYFLSDMRLGDNGITSCKHLSKRDRFN